MNEFTPKSALPMRPQDYADAARNLRQIAGRIEASGPDAAALVALLRSAPIRGEHAPGPDGPCLCSACEWFRARRALLAGLGEVSHGG